MKTMNEKVTSLLKIDKETIEERVEVFTFVDTEANVSYLIDKNSKLEISSDGLRVTNSKYGDMIYVYEGNGNGVIDVDGTFSEEFLSKVDEISTIISALNDFDKSKISTRGDIIKSTQKILDKGMK